MTNMTSGRIFPGRHFPAKGRVLGTAGATPPLNKLIALPYDIAGSFDAIAALNKYGGSGNALMRAGLYSCNFPGLPTTLLADTGDYEVDTAHQGLIAMALDETLYFDTPLWVVGLFGGDTAPNMLSSAAISAYEMQQTFGVGTSQLELGMFTGSNAILADYEYGPLPETFPLESAVLSSSSLWLSLRSAEASE